LENWYGGGVCGRFRRAIAQILRDRSEVAMIHSDCRRLATPSFRRPELPPGELSITADRSHRVLVLTLRGELDLASAPQLKAELRRAEATETAMVVVDLAGVEFMDSSGLHVLLAARECLRRTGRPLSLSRVSPQVRRLLELTRMLELFSVEGLRDASAARGVRAHDA
jgi:anti-sigma B factor antagonist